MTAEVILTTEQEQQLALVHEKRGESCTEQELIQDLFNEALRANYITFRSAAGELPGQSSLVCIDFEADDMPTDEEIEAILTEIHEERGTQLA